MGGGEPIQFSQFCPTVVPMTRARQPSRAVLPARLHTRSSLSWKWRYPQCLKMIWGKLNKKIVLWSGIVWSESRFPWQRDYKQTEGYLEMQNYCQCFFLDSTQLNMKAKQPLCIQTKNKQHSLCFIMSDALFIYSLISKRWPHSEESINTVRKKLLCLF